MVHKNLREMIRHTAERGIRPALHQRLLWTEQNMRALAPMV